MEVRYTAIYRLLGLNKILGDAETQDFVALPNFNATVKFTINLEPFCFHLDRATALATQLLNGLFGQDREGTPGERLAAEIEEVRATRQKKNNAGLFLVFEGTQDVAPPNFKIRHGMDDFAVCFDAFDKGEVREKFRPALYGVLAAIGLTLPERVDHQVEKIGDVSYLIGSGSGKVIYSFTAEFAPATLSLTTPLSEDVIERARSRARVFPVDGTLAKVANLLIESLETKTNELRAFIAAWSALEIFVNAMFKAVYEEQWFQLLSLNAPVSSTPYFDRLKDVMNDKHRLTDKFLVIASILDSASAEKDASDFRRLKSVRDGLFHASEGATSRYPVENTQNLLRKYLDLHLVQHGGFQGET